MTCLHSALAVLSIFPNQPDPIWVCHILWWNVLHFLVQATTILLINISLENFASKEQRGQNCTSGLNAGHLHGSSEGANSQAVYTATKKALQWLYCLGKTEVSARRAFEICNNCIRRIAPTGFDLDEFVPLGTESNVHCLAVPTDQFHQQNRCKDDVSYSRFAGTRDFGYDRSAGVSAQFLEQGPTENFDLPLQPSFGVLGDEINMPDYIPEPHESLDEVLFSLAGPDNEAT